MYYFSKHTIFARCCKGSIRKSVQAWHFTYIAEHKNSVSSSKSILFALMYTIEGTKEKSTMKTMMVRGSPILRYMLAAAAIVIVVFGLKYSSDVLAPIFFAATLAILGVFLSFLFWSWVFGFVGALLAIPATLFVKTLLQGRQETRFLVVLLSGQGDSDITVTIPHDRQDENNTVEEHTDSPDTRRTTLIADATDSTVHEE
jgi:hypothetical protein